MPFLKKSKVNENEVLRCGFLGGMAQAVYIFVVVSLMMLLDQVMPAPKNHLFTGFVILTLFVFSVAVSGILVFGYPVYMAFQKRYSEALMTAITSLVTLAIIGILVFMLLSFI